MLRIDKNIIILLVVSSWLILSLRVSAQQIGQLDSTFADRLLPADPEGISGADGVLSIDLGHHKSLFIWGDSFLGPVKNDTRLPPSKFILGNTATLWDGNTAQSLYGGDFRDPESFIPVRADGEKELWYWPGDGFVRGNDIFLFLSKYSKKEGESGPFAFVYEGCDLVLLDRDSFQIQDTQHFLDRNSTIHYGHATLRQGPYLYIYGSKADNVNFHAELHVMRTKIRDDKLDAHPAYWDGHSWNSDPQSSQPIKGINSAVSEQFSIRKINGKIVLLNQDRYHTPGQIYTYQSLHPTGPFTDEQLVYTIDEPGLTTDSLFTYNAMLHPQIRRDGRILVSYNVNTFSTSLWWKKASVYRPRFLWIPLTALRSD